MSAGIGLLVTMEQGQSSNCFIRLSKSFKSYENELVKIQSYRAFDFYAIQERWYKESPSEFDALIIYPESNDSGFAS